MIKYLEEKRKTFKQRGLKVRKFSFSEIVLSHYYILEFRSYSFHIQTVLSLKDCLRYLFVPLNMTRLIYCEIFTFSQQGLSYIL